MNHSLENEVIHRHYAGQSLRGIARDLQIGRDRVAGIVRRHVAARQGSDETPPARLGPPPTPRGSKLDAFQAQIAALLERYPRLSATRVWEELRQAGYQGGYTMVRNRVKTMRKAPMRPLTVRFETAPGSQAQMDWSTYELDFSQEGRRRVNLFSYLLGYSRRQYLNFTERQDFDTTVREHIKAFEYLQGVAATCLYDNMKVVVTRWEDEQPIYNTRFLAFATHYGYRPWACRPRRPETKGKVERPFQYVEQNLLGGRTFRSLEHLNEVTRWWLSNHADVRIHGTTQQRPMDAHAIEQPQLLPLPAQPYDTAQVVYRVVTDEGTVHYANNRYSVPWQLVGELLPVRVTEDQLLVYNRHLQQVACHTLQRHVDRAVIRDPAHAPPRDAEAQVAELRQRFEELGEVGQRFFAGLLQKQRTAKHQAQRVLLLLQAYQRQDVVLALERAVAYHAYSLAALERILAHQATPKLSWQVLSQSEQDALQRLMVTPPVKPRPSSAYQSLLFPWSEPDDTREISPPCQAYSEHADGQRPAAHEDPEPSPDPQDPTAG